MDSNLVVDVIVTVVKALEGAGVEYAITGSVASGMHGEPVSTQDVDVMVKMTPEQARRVADALPERFYRNAERLAEVALNGGIANVIDADAGFKADLCVVPNTPFFEGVYGRRRPKAFSVGGPVFDVVTPEDVILMKLLWRLDSGSRKQWDNALSVAQVQGATMDWKYLFDQARDLGIEDDLIKLRDEAGI